MCYPRKYISLITLWDIIDCASVISSITGPCETVGGWCVELLDCELLMMCSVRKFSCKTIVLLTVVWQQSIAFAALQWGIWGICHFKKTNTYPHQYNIHIHLCVCMLGGSIINKLTVRWQYFRTLAAPLCSICHISKTNIFIHWSSIYQCGREKSTRQSLLTRLSTLFVVLLCPLFNTYILNKYIKY